MSARNEQFRKLVDELQRQVSDSFAPGERLPSRRELAAMYGVGATTIDRALKSLSKTGLVHPATRVGWFRAAALFVPPMAGTFVIVRRRQSWSGCQWLFWATIALGLAMSAIGLTGWAADELMFARDTWLAWPAVFALFGAVAPLFALLAQPHRGAREPLAATTAIDIAGLAVVTGFLYSFFVTTPDAGLAVKPLGWTS